MVRPATAELVARAFELKTVIPGFNIPYLPMMAPVVQALRDTRCVGLIMVARLELIKFQAQSLAAVKQEYDRLADPRHTRLHLDHLPVVDEDGQRIDYPAEIEAALQLGYESVMVDGSRLPLDENIAATRRIVDLAQRVGVPVEAELGAVLGHEAGPRPSYEELFATGRGFTRPEEARRFVKETGADWLSVAIGNIHGAIAQAQKDQEKPRARLNLDQLERIREATNVPLVLHGGTGIAAADIRAAVARGISKINVGTAIRQPYERALKGGVSSAQDAVYHAMRSIINDELAIGGSADAL
jgi:ketose-bisphosphate aldolase